MFVLIKHLEGDKVKGLQTLLIKTPLHPSSYSTTSGLMLAFCFS